MRIHYLLGCLLGLSIALAAFANASGDDTIPQAVTAPRRSRLTLFINPLRRVIDLFVGRHAETPEDERDSLPWTALNIPSYAHAAEDGWFVHIHGSLYKRQIFTTSKWNKIVNRLLVRARIGRPPWYQRPFGIQVLNDTEADNARLHMRDLATLSIQNGILSASINDCDIGELPVMSNAEGSFDAMMRIPEECINRTQGYKHESGDISSANITLKPINVYSDRDTDYEDDPDTAKAFLVPPKGITIVADIDEVLRVTRVWNFKQAILNVLVLEYEPWRDMSEVLWDLKRELEAQGQNVHFHYLTDAPEPIARRYIGGTKRFFPDGSFDFRSLNLTKTTEMFKSRKYNMERLLNTFPDRKFIFLGDTTNPGMMRWPKLLDKDQYARQIQCILMRDTRVTEASDWMTPNTRHFVSMPKTNYLFYRTPSDLRHLNAAHLAALSPRNDSPATMGCFDWEHKIPQSLKPSKARFAMARSVLRAMWWRIQCAIIPSKWKPNHRCPFDRIPGTTYWNGDVEEEVDVPDYSVVGLVQQGLQ